MAAATRGRLTSRSLKWKPHRQGRWPRREWPRFSLLALLAVLAGGAALRESVAIDELAHIGAGVSYWQRLDLRLNPEHPPLVKLLAAAPLAAGGCMPTTAASPGACEGGQAPFNPFLADWPFGASVVERWNDATPRSAWARLP